jgi:CheY-like chemotaxis protein
MCMSVTRPVVMAIDEDPGSLARVRHELEKRYTADYRIVCEPSPRSALETLRVLADAGCPVAIVLADLRLRQMSGPELLGRAPESSVAGEQYEHSPVRGVREIAHNLDHRRAMTRLVRSGLGQVVGHAEHTLRREVERRRKYLPHPDR